MRVAAFQRRPVLDDPRAVSAGIAEDVAWAASNGVSLAVFPEAYLDGHSYDRETVSARARTLDDPEVQRLARSLRRFPVTLIIGMFERRANTVRNVALVLHAGEIIGVYAKAYPNEDGVQAGDDVPIFEAGGARFAVNICNDANYPDLAQRAGKSGASVLCYPLNNVLPPATAERWREQHRQSHRSCARDQLLGNLIRCHWSMRRPGEPGLHGHHQPGRRDQSTRARGRDRNNPA
jgi:predicted amidohydrolase